MTSHSLPQAIKGRAALGNPADRFARTTTEPADDGWQPVRWGAALGHASQLSCDDACDDESLWGAPLWRTEVLTELAKSAMSRNSSPDVPFDRSLNPYRGCEHGCIYCFARPTHNYLGLSAGLDFERKIVAKLNLAEVLAKALSKSQYQAAPVAIGTVTDAYQPIERTMGLTRKLLEVLVARRHPFSIITKSAGVERDLDLIAPMARQGLASVYVTITSLDGELCRRMEPRAASPLRRLRTIRTLAEAGVPVGVSLAPQIPFLNDDMEKVLTAASEAGATRAFYSVLRLPWDLNDLFREWLVAHFPERADRVMARVRDLQGGKRYESAHGTRMQGQGVWADLLSQRFRRSCAKLGLNAREFHTPTPNSPQGPSPQQGTLF